MGLITLTEKLRKPDREYTAFPFWFFNGDFTDEEIIRQIRDFRDKGIYGFVLHPRMGNPGKHSLPVRCFYALCEDCGGNSPRRKDAGCAV